MSTITPYISAKSAAAVIDFCIKVFGAKETMRQTDDAGAVRHAQITIGDSTLMLSDQTRAYPDMRGVESYRGSTSNGRPPHRPVPRRSHHRRRSSLSYTAHPPEEAKKVPADSSESWRRTAKNTPTQASGASANMIVDLASTPLDAAAQTACFTCHIPRKEQGYVFTEYHNRWALQEADPSASVV